MVNRILRDDPAKGIVALQEPATFRDILNAWSDKSMWGLYFIGLVAYIPASPVQGYLSLTLKRIGFSTFDSNMLSIPSAVLQIILMLALAYSSNHFSERTFHCFIGEFWCLPLLVVLLTLPAGGHEWGRFTVTTMIAGCEYTSILYSMRHELTDNADPYFHPIVSAWISENSFDVKKRAITAATYNVIVQIGSVISSRKSYSSHSYQRLNPPDTDYRALPQGRCPLLPPRQQDPHLHLRPVARGLHFPKRVSPFPQQEKGEGLGCYDHWRACCVPGGSGGEREGRQQALGLPIPILSAGLVSLIARHMPYHIIADHRNAIVLMTTMKGT
jgi:hypothetical protein